MNGGCVLVARKMLDSDLMDQSPLVVKLWIWLILKANWKDRAQLRRGQLVTTIAEMQEAMSHYSGWRKICPTSDQIRSAYGALRDTARITVRRTTRGMVVTILNYDVYQDTLSYASRTGPRDGTDTGPAATPHDTESLNQETITCSFSTFWDAYPRKVGKAQAAKSWAKLNPDSTLQGLIFKSLEWQTQQSDWKKDAGKFIPHAATWLNGRRWEDERPQSISQSDGIGHYR